MCFCSLYHYCADRQNMYSISMFSVPLEFFDSLTNITETSNSGCSLSALTIILDELPNKRQRFKDTSDAVFAKRVKRKFD